MEESTESLSTRAEPTTFLPRDISKTMMMGIVILAFFSAAEIFAMQAANSPYNYSLWPDDFLLACGEMDNIRPVVGKSHWMIAAIVMGCGMLILMISENYWDRLRIAWQASQAAGNSPVETESIMLAIHSNFRNLMFVMMGIILLVRLPE